MPIPNIYQRAGESRGRGKKKMNGMKNADHDNKVQRGKDDWSAPSLAQLLNNKIWK